MMIKNMKNIEARIATIERRFNSDEDDFAAQLQDAIQNNQSNISFPQGVVEDEVRLAAKRHGVDANLALALAEAESGFNATAQSSAGAVGVMQLMPDTAASLGVDINDYKQNIDGGVRYLKQQLQKFGGDINKALAAYNAGPAAVEQYGGVPPYRETQNYVAAITGRLQGAR